MVKKVGLVVLLAAAVLGYWQTREQPTATSYARYLIKVIDRAQINVHLDRRGVALVFKGSDLGCGRFRRVVRESADESPTGQVVKCMVGDVEVWSETQ